MLKQIANLDINLLTKSYYCGCKTDETTGIEFEKLPVYSLNYKSVKYEDIARFMLQFKNGGWMGAYSDGHIIGLNNDDGAITLEPGSQFELSLNPVSSLNVIKEKIDVYNQKTAQLGDKLGITWLGYGIQPLSTNKNIEIIPKKRYECMTEYLPKVASKPLVMMRETSGIQVGIDYSSHEDAMKKLSTALKLSPIVSAIFANSPIRNGKLTRYKSYRAYSWLHTDSERCGLISPKLFNKTPEFSFEDYAQILLDVPMIFIERPHSIGGAIPVKNLTFRKFIEEGYCGLTATIDDWDLHCSLYFPDVRLKSYIEIRNQDNQRSPLIPAIPAFWKGIMYNKDALDAIGELLKVFTYPDFEYLRYKTPRAGLELKIKKTSLKEIAQEIISISYNSLKNTNEESLLEPIKELIDAGLVPADIIIKNWDGCWNKDLSKLIDYTALK